jgi:predicted PurR-regulated permease PerM
MENQNHPFSWQALGRIVATGLIVFVAWQAIGVLVLILIALVFSVSLSPIVNKFSEKLPLVLSIVIVLILLFIPLIALGFFVVYNLMSQFPALLEMINSIANNTTFITHYFGNFNIIQYLQNSSVYILNSTKNIFLSIISIFTVIFLTFYFVYDSKRLLKLFLDLFPVKEQKAIHDLLEKIALVTGKYIRGNVLISIITGIIIYIGLLILQIPFALPIAIFTAILDLLPMVGPILGSLPALIIGFSISPLRGILVILLYFLYQQGENIFISPVIYNKALNISPAITFISVVIGGSVFGILGAFLALPVAASIPAIIDFKNEYTKKQSKK